MLHHISLAVPDLATAGGTDNGAPGLRPNYGNDYYAAFVVDPCGHRIEAVINVPA